MVRAGVVAHPSEWAFSGFREIQEPRRKCALIANERLRELAGFSTYGEMRTTHGSWIEASLEERTSVRESKWTRSIAVGSEEFIKATKESLGQRAKGREVLGAGSALQLREPGASYKGHFGTEKGDIGGENTYFWNDWLDDSDR